MYGGYLIIRSSLKPVRDMTETAEAIAHSNDLSKRIYIEEGTDEVHKLGKIFNEMLETLENSSKRERQFSSDVSHELRTPISVVMAESEYGAKYTDSIEDAKESFEVIERQSKRMASMINQILELARLDSRLEIPKQEVKLSEKIKHTLEDYKILFDNKTRNNRDLMKTINAGLFEIGIAKPGEQPTSWTTFKYESEYPVSIAPYKLSDYYNTRGKLQVYVRLRRCHNIIYTSPAQFSSPTLENPQITNSANCGYKTITIAPNKLSSGLFCYPLTLTALKDDGSKQIIYGPITINKPGDKSAIIEIPIGTKYKIDVKDANGVQRASYQGEAKGYFNQLGSKKDYCDGWQINFVPDLVSTCSPVKVDIIEEGSTIPIKSYTFTSATHQLSPRLLYNKNYIFHAYLENNPLISYKEIKNNYKSQQKPQLDRITYQISNTPNLAIVSVRELSADPKILRLYRNNELIAETDSKGQTAASFNNIQLPPGNYRIEIIDPICGNSEIPFMAKGGYELKNFSLTTSINCHGGKVTPSGVICFEGKPQPNNTVFRILSFSPSNPSVSAAIDTRLYRAGEVIQLPNDGDYVISAHWEQTYDRRFPEYSLLGSETFQVKREPLGLSQLDTWAYTCNKRSIGHILVKGKGGTLPYRYELWDKNNTKKLEDATYELGTNDVAHFEYGAAGEQYTLHIIDDCTNFIQAITIADYETYNIGSTPRRVLCIGDVIELHAVRLPNYTWKDPQGHVLSHNQDCTITDVQISNFSSYSDFKVAN